MNSESIRQLQQQLGLPVTGVMDSGTLQAMNSAVSKAVAANPVVQQFGGGNSVDQILNAYTTNDWSGVVDLTGKPFTNKQQEEAVRQAETALAPAYQAQEAYDRSVAEDSLRQEREGYDTFLKGEEQDFKTQKDSLDQGAADQGILFSGARKEREMDLRNTYEDRAALQRRNVADRVGTTARAYQYTYGDEGAGKLSDFYNVSNTPTYNAGVARGQVNPGGSLGSVYDPGKYKFQGTAPVAQKAAVQTRASGLLANRANKLTSTGYKNQF